MLVRPHHDTAESAARLSPVSAPVTTEGGAGCATACGTCATCTVADSGRGIPPEDKPRLFEPYFSTKKGGTGLGLAIVNSIIADHHGFIRVRDNQPRGTLFVIELPVKTTPA